MWRRQGVIFKPDENLPWAKSHAQVPTPIYNSETNSIRIFFSSRDEKNRSLISFVDVDADDQKKIIKISDKPILELGSIGAFDDSGMMPSWILNKSAQEIWLYYIGWNVRNTVPYSNSIGLAISRDGGNTFERYSEGPILDRSVHDPFFTGSSCVIFDNGVYKNWYLSCTEWRIVNDKPEPRYLIKYAESEDGIHWKTEGKIALDYASDNEAGIVKASVIIEDGIYKMWYSYRSFEDYRTSLKSSYKIGYAESQDGINWERKDQSSLALQPSEDSNDWDGMMVEYPHVIDVKGKRIMFYNGNGFGQTGFGFAVWEE